VGSYWVRFSMRSGGGIMALLTFLITGLTVASVFVSPIEAIVDQSNSLGHTAEEAVEQVDQLARSDQFVDVMEWVTGSDTAEAEYLLRTQPALLSAIFVILLICFPYVTCIGAFNQTSSDIRSKGLRYLLLRTERPNVFLGRFLGTVAFVAISIVMVIALITAYIGFKFGLYPASPLVGWAAQGALAMFLLSLPYIAMCSWISGLLDTAFGSLASNLMLVGFPLILIKTADATLPADLEWMTRILPWGWKTDLLSGDPATRALACGMMLAFTTGFLFLGLRSFRKRDL